MKTAKKSFSLIFLVLMIFSALAINSSAASVSYYQTNKADVPIWSSDSSKSTKMRVVTYSGTVLKLVAQTTNSSGNVWYKLDNGTWVYSGNVTQHTHSYNSGGYCTGRECGYEWPYSVSSASGTYQVVNSSGAKIWSRPYSNNSTHLRTLSNGSTLTINGVTKNKEGNTWYRLSNGGWVFSGNVKQRFAITFNANGGSGAPSTQYVLADTGFVLTSQNPTRSQYIFKGWATSSGSTSVRCVGGGSYRVSGNLTLYAVWEKCSHSKYEGGYCTTCGYEWPYSVSSYSGTFQVANSDGAKIWSRPYSNRSTHIRTMSNGSLLTIVAKTTNRDENVWYKLSDGYWVFSGNVKQRFAITFNANGGSGAPSTQYVLDRVSFTLSNQKPTRSQYIFKGWAQSSTATKAEFTPGSSCSAYKNVTLYAVWSKCGHSSYTGGVCDACKFTFPLNVTSYSGIFVVTNDNGAKIWSQPYSDGSSKTVRTDKKNTVLTITNKVTNAENKLWYKLSDGNWVYSGNVTQRFTVKYDANGGNSQSAPSSKTFVLGNKFTVSTTKPTRVGYVFQGWSTSKTATNVSYKSGSTYTFSKDVTLYAVWKACGHSAYSGGYCSSCGYEYPINVTSMSGIYVVTNSDGAKVWSRPYSNKSTHVRTEKKNAKLTVVGKTTNAETHVWYKLSDGNWVYSNNLKKQITISYNANGGSGTLGSQTATSGSSLKILSTKPTRTEYIFQGWSTSKTATKVSHKSGSTYTFSNDTTLYAVWKKCGHSSYTGGVCDTCKYTYPLNVIGFSATFVVTNSNGAKIWSQPYSDGSSKTVRTEKQNAVLTVTHKVTNAENKLWYKLSDGYWVYSGNLTQRFTIKYNVNGGESSNPKSKTCLNGNSLTVTTNKPTRVGYIFKGWGTSKTATKVSYKSGSSYKFTKSMTLYAVWEKCTDHNYKNNGGICKNCKFEYESKFTSVDGRVYVKNEKGAAIYSRPYAENAKKIRTEKYKKVLSIVGYCKNQEKETWYKLTDGNWVCKDNVVRQYIVTYNLNGGTGTFKSQKFLSGKSVTISKTKPTLSGYIFLGWDTSEDAMKVVYKPGAKYSKKADVTLYAVWSKDGVNPVEPIREIEIVDYSAGVTKGKIRYCNQKPLYATENGWRASDIPRCSGMCNRACESMAFSYIGIDQSPSSMHDNDTIIMFELAKKGVNAGYTANLKDVYGNDVKVQLNGGYYKNSFNRAELDNLVAQFENDNGEGLVSPVLLHYDKIVNEVYYSHWILLLSKNDDGSYKAIGPWSENGLDGERIKFNVWISDSGVVSGSDFSGSGESRTVSHVGQYCIMS